MTSGQEDTYSYDLTALTDYEPQTIQTAPPTVGHGTFGAEFKFFYEPVKQEQRYAL